MSIEREVPEGYRSAEANKKFKKKAWLALVVVAGLQFVIPLVHSIVTMADSFQEALNPRIMDPARAVYWNDALWLLEQRGGIGASMADPRSAALLSWQPGDEEWRRIGELPTMDDPRLVAVADDLWVICLREVVKINPRETRRMYMYDVVDEATAPFAYGGRPAFIGFDGDGYVLMTAGEHGWERDDSQNLGEGEGLFGFDLRDLTALPGPDGKVALLLRLDGSLFYLPDWTGFSDVPISGWEKVIDDNYTLLTWTAAPDRLSSDVYAFAVTRADIEIETKGFVRHRGAWRDMLSLEFNVPGSMKAFSRDGAGKILLAAQGLPGTLRVWELEDGRVVGDHRLGNVDAQTGGTTVASLALQGSLSILTLILVLVLASAMARYKTSTYIYKGVTVELASLPRRAAASLVDGLLGVAPLVLIWLAVVEGNPLDLEIGGISGVISFMGFVGLASLWGLVALILVSAMEGRLGYSVGKLALGVRVVNMELETCGFGKAFVRNILKGVADIFLNFALGMAFIAFTSKRQRVGDLAGRTIVVISR